MKLDKRPAPGKGPRLPERRPRFLMWIYLAVFLALMVHFFLNVSDVKPNEIEYSTFLDYVRKGYRTFILDIPPNREELEHTSIVFSQAVAGVGA